MSNHLILSGYYSQTHQIKSILFTTGRRNGESGDVQIQTHYLDDAWEGKKVMQNYKHYNSPICTEPDEPPKPCQMQKSEK